jgi:hypothetical protein
MVTVAMGQLKLIATVKWVCVATVTIYSSKKSQYFMSTKGYRSLQPTLKMSFQPTVKTFF